MAEQGTCPNCSADVPEGVDTCPDCGLTPKRKLFTFALVVILIGGTITWAGLPGGLGVIFLGAGLAVASRLGPTVWA